MAQHVAAAAAAAFGLQILWFSRLQTAAAQWFEMTKTRQKQVYLIRFHGFFQTDFRRFA